jgi:XTP/dITP diphosphohydrolase
MSREILFLTSNPIKIKTAERALGSFGIKVKPIKIEVPEIQADTSAEVARFAVLAAIAQLGAPVIREDHAFHIDTLNGFPGPYMAHVEKQISEDRLLDMMRNEKNRNSRFELSLAYSDEQGNVQEFTHRVPTLISKDARGNLSRGWNRVITLVDDDRTLAEYPYDDRIDLHTQNYIYLAQFLLSI